MSEFADKEVDELKRVSFSGRSIIHPTLAMVIPANGRFHPECPVDTVREAIMRWSAADQTKWDDRAASKKDRRMHIASIGIDLGKTTFHLVALDQNSRVRVPADRVEHRS